MIEIPNWEEVRAGDLLKYAGHFAMASLKEILATEEGYREGKTKKTGLFRFRPAPGLELQFWANTRRKNKELSRVLAPTMAVFTNHDPEIDQAITIDVLDEFQPDEHVYKKVPWAEPILMPFVVVRFTDV